MDQFVVRENVKHFRRELENGADEQRRAMLVGLLVEEENHLGLTREQLSRLDRHIERLSEIMARQVELIDNLNSLNAPTERAQIMLATLNDLMAAYIAHRQKISAALVNGGP